MLGRLVRVARADQGGWGFDGPVVGGGLGPHPMRPARA